MKPQDRHRRILWSVDRPDRARHRAYWLIFLLVLAPIGAVVIIAALLLFGVDPHTVFLPGHALKAALSGRGIQAPNAVGVLTTVFVWWLILAAAGFVWERNR